MNALTSILILLAAAVAVFCEAAFHGVRHLLGAQIDLLPGLIVFASLSSGLLTTSTAAIAGGLWFDSLSANPLGVSVLPLLLVGVLVHSQRELILRDQFFAQLVLGMAASGLVPVLTLLLILTRGEPPLIGWGSLWQWVVLTVGGGVATPIWFKVFGLVDRTFNYQRVRESAFRADREIRRGRK